jgi:hypothetical protein
MTADIMLTPNEVIALLIFLGLVPGMVMVVGWWRNYL